MPVPVSASVFSSFCKTLHLRARHNMRPVDEWQPRPPARMCKQQYRVREVLKSRTCILPPLGEKKKIVACFLKLMARISKSEPLIFDTLQTRMNTKVCAVC